MCLDPNFYTKFLQELLRYNYTVDRKRSLQVEPFEAEVKDAFISHGESELRWRSLLDAELGSCLVLRNDAECRR